MWMDNKEAEATDGAHPRQQIESKGEKINGASAALEARRADVARDVQKLGLLTGEAPPVSRTLTDIGRLVIVKAANLRKLKRVGTKKEIDAARQELDSLRAQAQEEAKAIRNTRLRQRRKERAGKV